MPDASAVNPPEVSDPSVHVLRDAVVKNSSMITSTVNKDLTGCEIRFTGEWNQIKDKNYQKKLENLFYEYYPRILKRWGTENTHRVIYFKAGNFDFFAGASGNEIGINIDGANTSPEDIGYFAHELAHIVQGYNVDMNWFCEGMASYAGFRYFHWQHNDTLQPLYSKSQRIQTWTTYAPYGDCVPFFVYMDDKFPIYQKDGKKVLGLIDSIDQAAKNKTVRNVWNPDDPDTDLNRLVYKVTGGQYSTIEALRNQYLRECADGTWTFSGFADFKDNFLTQDVAGVNNTQQIAVKPISHASSAKNLSSLSLKENIFTGAKVVRSSGYIHDGEKDSFLVDGNTGSKWCARSGNVKDNTYAAHGAQHYILLDLGSEKNFDSYILHNTRSSEPSERNAVSWELLVSSDGKNFTSWDYQNGKNIDLGRFTPGSTSARYILMLVYEAELVYDSTHPYNSDESFDIVRLYELMGGLKK